MVVDACALCVWANTGKRLWVCGLQEVRIKWAMTYTALAGAGEGEVYTLELHRFTDSLVNELTVLSWPLTSLTPTSKVFA